MKKILMIFGTRPEAIKMCPLALELRSRADAETIICATGQHRELLSGAMDAFGLAPDINLNIMKPGQTLFDVTSDILLGLRDVLTQVKPDIALVHGDTTTAFAGALACFYMNIPVGHVEAGLRTYNLAAPFPEEYNRQAVDLTARWYFAPTERAKQNLLREGREEERIFVTGNTAIDALHTTVKGDYDDDTLKWAEGSRLVLLTAHRRESQGESMAGMFRAIRRVVSEHPDVKVVYPIHPNPKVRAPAMEVFSGCERIRLIEPLDVRPFHNYMARSYLILTDSGGIQEEAPALGKPVLVMRETTERPEGVEAGTLRLCGTGEEGVYSAFNELLCDASAYARMSRAANPYGDGTASRRIADILLR